MKVLMRRVLFIAVITCGFLIPAAVRAQNNSQDTPEEKTPERPTGLPSRVKWTFNFDAGWGNIRIRQLALPQPQGAGR